MKNGRSRGSSGCFRVSLEIIYEINRRLLDVVRTRFPGDEDQVERVSLIEEGPTRHVRMANMAIVGSHSTNGVADIHSRLLRTLRLRTLRNLSRALQQQDQWCHAATLAAHVQSGACGDDYRRDR